jgi:hypothetical protein
MSGEAWGFSWKIMVNLIHSLVRPACLNLLETNDKHSANTKRMLVGRKTIRTTPPHPTTSDSIVYVHTIVPSQIEDAARSMLGNCNFTGTFGFFQLILMRIPLNTMKPWKRQGRKPRRNMRLRMKVWKKTTCN